MNDMSRFFSIQMPVGSWTLEDDVLDLSSKMCWVFCIVVVWCVASVGPMCRCPVMMWDVHESLFRSTYRLHWKIFFISTICTMATMSWHATVPQALGFKWSPVPASLTFQIDNRRVWQPLLNVTAVTPHPMAPHVQIQASSDHRLWQHVLTCLLGFFAKMFPSPKDVSIPCWTKRCKKCDTNTLCM